MRTLTEYQPGDPVFMSGTRLDVAAIAGDQAVLNRLKARPPAWPWLDLSYSVVADHQLVVLAQLAVQSVPGLSVA